MPSRHELDPSYVGTKRSLDVVDAKNLKWNTGRRGVSTLGSSGRTINEGGKLAHYGHDRGVKLWTKIANMIMEAARVDPITKQRHHHPTFRINAE